MITLKNEKIIQIIYLEDITIEHNLLLLTDKGNIYSAYSDFSGSLELKLKTIQN